MTSLPLPPEIQHNPDNRRFLLKREGHTAVLQYTLHDGVMTFTHTGVPAALEGRGIGSQLARAGMEYARENNFKVVALCWFVSGYIDRHTEYQGMLKT